MDRVWQLELETLAATPGFVFAPITEVLEPGEDPTAPHAEVQRHVAGIRTNFDRFSELEISSLVRHGYRVGRKACRARPDLFGDDLRTERDLSWLHPRPKPVNSLSILRGVNSSGAGHGPDSRQAEQR
jgi:hypothetical protein